MGRIFGKFIGTGFQQEAPSGSRNGINLTFVLSQKPASVSGLILTLNGLVLERDTDFTVSNKTILMATAPAAGQRLWATYMKAN